MTDFDRPEEPEDRTSFAARLSNALKDAARQSDPREFNRLTRHALALIERARAIGHGEQRVISNVPETQVLQKDDAVRPGLSHKIIKFIVRLWRPSA